MKVENAPESEITELSERFKEYNEKVKIGKELPSNAAQILGIE